MFRALEADSRSLHSLSSQHRRLSPGSSDQAVVGAGGLSRGDSMTSLVSGASLGSVTGTAQGDDCELTSIISCFHRSLFDLVNILNKIGYW